MLDLSGITVKLFGRMGIALAPRPVALVGSYDSGSGNPTPISVAVGSNGSVSTTPTASVSTTAATFTQAIKLVTTAGTPVALGTGLVESLEIHARKSVLTANTGAIYVGFSATGGNNYRVLAVGESYPIPAPAGEKINLATIYIDAATSGDGVIVTTSN